jgi:hypothetical protein
MNSNTEEEVGMLPMLSIPQVPILHLMQSCPNLFDMGTNSYASESFMRERGEGGSYFFHFDITPPTELPTNTWRKADARETVWLIIFQRRYEESEPYAGLINTSSCLLLPSHLRTVLPTVLVECKSGGLTFRSGYSVDIPANTPSFWLTKIR